MNLQQQLTKLLNRESTRIDNDFALNESNLLNQLRELRNVYSTEMFILKLFQRVYPDLAQKLESIDFTIQGEITVYPDPSENSIVILGHTEADTQKIKDIFNNEYFSVIVPLNSNYLEFKMLY